MEKNQTIFSVNMLGELSFYYGGEAFSLNCNYTSKVMQLFLILIRAGEEGVSKDQILESLYRNDDIQDTKNAFRILVFRLRRLLEDTILPEGQYVKMKKGVYWLGGNLNIQIDAKEFEKSAQLALEENDKEEKLIRLKKACGWYLGEFLPVMVEEKWVLLERTRYKNIYFSCLKQCCEIMQEKKDYEELLYLCEKAVKLYPFEEWQLVQIDCLLALHRYKEALQVYEDAASMIFDESGFCPSEKMLARFRAMSGQIHYGMGNLTDIKGRLEEKNHELGAYYCSYPSFIDSYRIIIRMMERSGKSVFLMLCTLTDHKGNPLEKEGILMEYSTNLGYAIGLCLRRGDLYTRYSPNQFLILLIGIRQEDCDITYGRILQQFREKCTSQKVMIRYYVSSIAEIKNDKPRLSFGSSKSYWKKRE